VTTSGGGEGGGGVPGFLFGECAHEKGDGALAHALVDNLKKCYEIALCFSMHRRDGRHHNAVNE